MTATSRRRLSATIGWDDRLETVAGKHASKIEKAFGYRTVGDLMQHYPRRWVDKGSLSEFSGIEPDEYVTVVGRVGNAKLHPYSDRRRGGMAYRLEVMVDIEGHQLSMTFFDKKKHTADWRAKQIIPGRFGYFSGKVGQFRGKLQLTNPEFQMFGEPGGATEDAQDDAVTAWDELPQLLPIYPAVSGLDSTKLEKAIHLGLDLVNEVPETLPEEVRREHGFVSETEGAGGHPPAGQLGPEGRGREAAALRRGLRHPDGAGTATCSAARIARQPPRRSRGRTAGPLRRAAAVRADGGSAGGQQRGAGRPRRRSSHAPAASR